MNVTLVVDAFQVLNQSVKHLTHIPCIIHCYHSIWFDKYLLKCRLLMLNSFEEDTQNLYVLGVRHKARLL